MAGTDSGAPFQRIEELKRENEVLRERLEEGEEDIDRLRRENEQLRKELKAAGRGSKRGRRKPKADPKRPGHQAGQGPFTFRQAPAGAGANPEPPIEVPVTVRRPKRVFVDPLRRVAQTRLRAENGRP